MFAESCVFSSLKELRRASHIRSTTGWKDGGTRDVVFNPQGRAGCNQAATFVLHMNELPLVMRSESLKLLVINMSFRLTVRYMRVNETLRVFNEMKS